MTPRPSLSIVIVNRFAPPDGAPTAAAAAGLAQALAAALPRTRVSLLASRAAYSPGTGVDEVPTVRIPSLYAGAWRPARLAASLLEGWWLAWQAARGAEVVITLTDPPLLSLWAGPACRVFGRRWIEWTHDRYPEFFVAAGLVGEHNPLYRLLSRWDAALSPDAVIALGQGQLEHLARRRSGAAPGLILPVGLVEPPPLPRCEPACAAPLTLVYAGNLGDAHEPAALAAIVARADPARFRFTFAVRGGRAPELRRRLAGHPAVCWRERLDEAELMGAAAHLVSLAGPATHLSVPSKAVTAMSLGRPVLFVGQPEADSWRELAAAGWLIPGGPDGCPLPADIDAALAAIADPAGRRERAAAARIIAGRIGQRRRDAVAALAGMIADWFPQAAQ